jgi:hypothetical protein
MGRRLKLAVFGLLLACAVFPFQPAHAQLNSAVQGTVSDARGTHHLELDLA